MVDGVTADCDVAVVGAGVTGLATVRRLRERGVDVRAFERSDEPGGVIRSRTRDGRTLDLGPQRLRATPQITGLIEEMGLEDEVVRGDAGLPLGVLSEGRVRLAPLSPLAFVSTDLLSLRGKLRFLAEPLTGGAREDDTVAEFLERSFGEEAARRFLGPLYAGIYGSDPDAMPLRFSLGRLLETRGVGRSVLLWAARRWLGGAEVPPPLTFRDGLQRLPAAMYDDVADAVELGTPVTAVRRGEDGPVVEIGGDGGDVGADRVVVTTAADDAAELLRGDAGDCADALDALRYNPLAVVHLDASVEGPVGGRDRWMGYQVALDEGTATRGVTWNDAIFGRDGVHTCYLGGASAPDVVREADDEVAATAVEEFEAVTGGDAEPLNVHRTRMPAFDESWTAIEAMEPPEGVRIAGNYTGRAGIPGRLRQGRRIADALADDLADDAA